MKMVKSNYPVTVVVAPLDESVKCVTDAVTVTRFAPRPPRVVSWGTVKSRLTVLSCEIVPRTGDSE